MSIVGLSVGGAVTKLLDWGANWLFITRDIGILLAAAGIAHRWFKTDYRPDISPAVEIAQEPDSKPLPIVSSVVGTLFHSKNRAQMAPAFKVSAPAFN